MDQAQKMNQTPKSILAMLLLFGSMMCLVITIAYARQSGNTGIDTAKIQQMRALSEKNTVAP